MFGKEKKTTKKTEVLPTVVPCPTCSQLYESEEALHELLLHAQEKAKHHKRLHGYLIVSFDGADHRFLAIKWAGWATGLERLLKNAGVTS